MLMEGVDCMPLTAEEESLNVAKLFLVVVLKLFCQYGGNLKAAKILLVCFPFFRFFRFLFLLFCILLSWWLLAFSPDDEISTNDSLE